MTINKNGPEVREHLEANDHKDSAEDIMTAHNTSRREAGIATRLICQRIKAAAQAQGINFASLRRKTGLNPRAVLRVWVEIDPSSAAIERSREALGLTIEQVWGAR